MDSPPCQGAGGIARTRKVGEIVRVVAPECEALRFGNVNDHEVRYQVTEHVATLTLDAPERMNTISPTMLRDISRLLLRTDDVAEGVAAFMDEREPEFRGR